MRRLNLFLVVGMLVTFLAHAVMGALQLSGANTNTLKPLAWVCVGLMAAHIVVSAVLTVQTLYACKKSGTGYFRNNRMFWAKRITGLTILGKKNHRINHCHSACHAPDDISFRKRRCLSLAGVHLRENDLPDTLYCGDCSARSHQHQTAVDRFRRQGTSGFCR